MAKKPTSLRMSEEAKSLLERLAKKLGVSQTAILEIAIRKLAKEEEVTSETGLQVSAVSQPDN